MTTCRLDANTPPEDTVCATCVLFQAFEPSVDDGVEPGSDIKASIVDYFAGSLASVP
jgi:hypothetical protein